MNTYSRRDRNLGILVIVECLLIVGLVIVLAVLYGVVIPRKSGQAIEPPSPVAASAIPAEAGDQSTATSSPTPSALPSLDSAVPTATAAPSQALATVPVSAADPSLPTLPPEIATWPQEVFQIVNQLRAENGLPPYAYNEVLEWAARLHGQDCLQREYCDHTGSDGSNLKTRLERAGYDAAGQAEVIVYSSSPQAAVDWWMDEVPPDDPHRSALLSDWFTEIGVAVVDAGHTYYFIADLGRPAAP
jgi:uncharacterized protein YkwD